MAAPGHDDVMADGLHNTSNQRHVEVNHDPALALDREHHHAHLHHDAHAEQGREDEVVYSIGTTFEKSTIPQQDPQDHDLHRRHHPSKHQGAMEVIDAEKGIMSPAPLEEEDPQSHKVSAFYVKYRIFFHLFVWLFFTG